MGLWILAGTWSAGEELDGVVPDYVIDELASTPAMANQLVLAGLWEVYEGPSTIPNQCSTDPVGRSTIPTLSGWRFRNWGKYQPTRAQLEETREKERIRKASYRQSHRDTTGTPTGRTVGHHPESEHPDPTRPDPTRPIEEPDGSSSPTSALVIADRQDVERVCLHLAERIEANGAKKPTIGKTWHDAARLLIDNDGRSEQEIHGAIDWCQTDEFWRSNILSMPKLREKFDTMRLQAKRANTTKPRNGDIDWDAAFARAKATDERNSA